MSNNTHNYIYVVKDYDGNFRMMFRREFDELKVKMKIYGAYQQHNIRLAKEKVMKLERLKYLGELK